MLTCRPQASASYDTRRPRAAARSASAGVAGRRWGRRRARASGATRRADQNGVGAERASMTSNLRSAPPQVTTSRPGVGGVEVAEGLVEVDREAEVGTAGADLRGGTTARRRSRARRFRRRRSPAAAAARACIQRPGDADGADRGSAGRRSRAARRRAPDGSAVTDIPVPLSARLPFSTASLLPPSPRTGRGPRRYRRCGPVPGAVGRGARSPPALALPPRPALPPSIAA